MRPDKTAALRTSEGVIIMSESVTKSVICPKCRQQSSTNILISANTTEDADIRKNVLDESVFRWKCAKCGFNTRFQHPFLYNDIENKFMIYFIPQVERQRVVDQKLEQQYSDLSDIRKRIVPDINTLKEKIIIFEKGLDDMAIELTKLAVSEVVAKDTGHNVFSGYFTEIDEEKNTISFQFFVGGDKRSYIQSTRLDIYKRSIAIVRKHFAGSAQQQGFLNICRQWAKESLDAYKNAKK